MKWRQMMHLTEMVDGEKIPENFVPASYTMSFPAYNIAN